MVGDSETGAGPSQSASNSNVSVRRKRTPRVTTGQVDALLATLEARPYLHTRKFTGLQGRENFETGWKVVAEELNKLPNGSIKSPEQWMTMLAAATQVQADAAKMQAEAAKTQAEALLLFAQAATKIADDFTKFVNKNNQ